MSWVSWLLLRCRRAGGEGPEGPRWVVGSVPKTEIFAGSGYSVGGAVAQNKVRSGDTALSLGARHGAGIIASFDYQRFGLSDPGSRIRSGGVRESVEVCHCGGRTIPPTIDPSIVAAVFGKESAIAGDSFGAGHGVSPAVGRVAPRLPSTVIFDGEKTIADDK